MTAYKNLDNLQVGWFLAKENLGLEKLSIEPNLVLIRRQLLPKEFKSVSKHLVRIK